MPLDDRYFRFTIPWFPDWTIWEGMLNSQEQFALQLHILGWLILFFVAGNFLIDRWELNRRYYRPKACSREDES